MSNNSSNVFPTAPAILCAVVTLVPAPFSIEESMGRETPTASAQSADVSPATMRARRTASPFDTMRFLWHGPNATVHRATLVREDRQLLANGHLGAIQITVAS